ncbi:hypothetical protein BCR39DRAFT_542645 [Naematelia encephala]|uniref:Lysophospholipase NTE1 n=1 Tax=Naematelia encephala TaxID=71784 RepID=A0A1Y2AUP8_9TREE|nr:hypothetical protein BCR39DRAFT_542645 [Naematelia encephala]
MEDIVEPLKTDVNPLVTLVVAIIRAGLWVLDWIKTAVGWLTITLPGMILRMLHFSLTISLGFPSLLALFIGGLVALTFLIRYRYLARYTQLKETALPPPSPPSLAAQLLPLDVADSRSRSSRFHNYLDDFLSAIRIFGYLEKPVFHELSRHLQTRRLAAGDTLEIGGGDFWCVVEGNVQVFAPSLPEEYATPASPEPFGTTSSFNGYHLLNEVATGGTLSSLFSILTLFTEDIKLTWTPPNEEMEDLDGQRDGIKEDEISPPNGYRGKPRANSDVSQLDVEALGKTVAGFDDSSPQDSPKSRQRSSSVGTAVRETSDSATVDLTEPSSISAPATKFPSPVLDPVDRPRARQTTSMQGLNHDMPPTIMPTMEPLRGGFPSSPPSTKRPQPGVSGTHALKGTIARASVDTTLAVIPAEAFRKLTRKFPKASGQIVQVVLERFSRVTFTTAHKYLGLTREILRSESSLNHLVSHPLPRAFYTGGGMQNLRDRFQPQSSTHHTDDKPSSSTTSSPTQKDGIKSRDYFNFVPVSPTVRAPSLPSVTPRLAMTPSASFDRHKRGGSVEAQAPLDAEKEKPGIPSIGPSTAATFSPDTATRHSSAFIRRASAMRKQVAAGDLAMTSTSGPDSTGGAYYRPAAQTPGLPRMDTWRGQFSGSTTDLRQHGGMPMVLSPDDEDGNEREETFQLQEEVLACIAKSIGLTQPGEGGVDSLGRSPFAPSVSALSTPNSPMFPPNGRPSSRSPFGNVLDMMNASAHNENILGGMLREAVMHARGDDEASSVSASVQESAMGGTGASLDISKHVFRDLEGKVEILFFKKGSRLAEEGKRSPGIFYVIDGFLDVSIPTRPAGVDTPRSTKATNSNANPPPSSFSNVNGRPFGAALGLGQHDEPQFSPRSNEEPLFTVKPGGIAGYLASLCSTDSYVNIEAKTDCYVGFLPNHALERIIERRPIVLLTLAKRLLSLLSPLVLHIDAGLDWMQLSAGQVLYEKGDLSTDFYIVINGRLRSLNEKDSGVEVLHEYGQNDSVGELDVITAVNRSDTVHAIRDSELVRIPGALFDAISIKHPATTVQFMRVIAGRVKRAMGEDRLTAGMSTIGAQRANRDVNLKTVCILGSNRSVPVGHFAGKLKTSLEELGASTSYLDQGTVMRHLGRHAFARIGKLKIAGWLADQEVSCAPWFLCRLADSAKQHYRSVLYVADTPPSSQWTLTCIRQADLILVLGMGDDPSLGEYEKLLLATKTTARKELILLHDERTVASGSTRAWLQLRPWVHAHHHVELPGVITPHKATPTMHDPAAVAAFKHLRERVETRIKKYRGLRPLGRPRRPAHMNDFARIARRLCGKQIGLVLGGGGARGVAHIGMLQALEEAGVPIDAIGGCSIGSFVGGLYARETDLLETTGRTKQFAGRMGSMLRILSDVTYPYVAYTTGHEFNRGIYKAFYNTHIEDFWLPFFANSTNITHSRMEVHRSGYAWRYVRASMTLAGLLPPLSDNGNLLVDGGYMDNTPIGPLRANGIRDIIVVDVGAIDDTSPRNYGDSVSGWWIFLNKLNPFYQRNVLSMTEISSRLAYVSSVKTLEDVKTDPSCLYISMPVQEFDTLGGFKRFSDVLAVGIKSGREAIREWRDQGRLPTGLVDEKRGAGLVQTGNRLRRMSI